MVPKSKISSLEFEYSELEITEQEGSIGGKWYPGKYIGQGIGKLFGGGGRSAPSLQPNLSPGTPGSGGCFPQGGSLLFSRLFNSLFGGLF